jgi:hypothetical protein
MHFLLLLLFSVALHEGPIIDPNGGRLAAHGDNGACIDPWDRCRDTTALGDDGVGIDPHGGARTAAGDHRCSIDPNGGCTDNALSDRGAGLDPNG